MRTTTVTGPPRFGGPRQPPHDTGLCLPLGRPGPHLPGGTSVMALVAFSVCLPGAPGFNSHSQLPRSARRQSSTACPYSPAPHPVWVHTAFLSLLLNPCNLRVSTHTRGLNQTQALVRTASPENRTVAREVRTLSPHTKELTKSLRGGSGVGGMHPTGIPAFSDAWGDFNR